MLVSKNNIIRDSNSGTVFYKAGGSQKDEQPVRVARVRTLKGTDTQAKDPQDDESPS